MTRYKEVTAALWVAVFLVVPASATAETIAATIALVPAEIGAPFIPPDGSKKATAQLACESWAGSNPVQAVRYSTDPANGSYAGYNCNFLAPGWGDFGQLRVMGTRLCPSGTPNGQNANYCNALACPANQGWALTVTGSTGTCTRADCPADTTRNAETGACDPVCPAGLTVSGAGQCICPL